MAGHRQFRDYGGSNQLGRAHHSRCDMSDLCHAVDAATVIQLAAHFECQRVARPWHIRDSVDLDDHFDPTWRFIFTLASHYDRAIRLDSS